MTKKITKLLVVMAAITTLFFISSAPAVFAPERNTGIDSDNCGNCHPGGSSGGTFEITGIPASYTPGQSYSAQLCLTDANANSVAGGFSMRQDDYASNALSTGDATSRLLPGGSWLTHNLKKFFTNDEACWDFVWNAPSVGSGTKTVSAAGNAVNDNESSSGDRPHFQTSVMSSEGALPVDLVHLSLSKNNSNSVSLKWETATEINNDYFLIERSYNAREFVEIGKVEGAGNTTDNETYSFIDEKPELNRPIYYRLKQVDFDGAFEYSLIKKITIEQSAINIEKVYPNPVFRSETVKVKFDLMMNSQEVEMIVYDILGHEKMRSFSSVTTGTNTINFSPRDLPAGQYYISLIADNQQIMSDMFIVTK